MNTSDYPQTKNKTERKTLDMLERRIKQFQDQTHVRRDVVLGSIFIGLIAVSFIMAFIGFSVIGGPAFSVATLSVYHGLRWGFARHDEQKCQQQLNRLSEERKSQNNIEEALKKQIENSKKTQRFSLFTLTLFACLTTVIIVGTTFFPATPFLLLGLFLGANILMQRHQAWINNANARNQQQALQHALDKIPKDGLIRSISNIFRQIAQTRPRGPKTVAFIFGAVLTSPLWISLMMIDRLAESISHYLETPVFKKDYTPRRLFLMLDYLLRIISLPIALPFKSVMDAFSKSAQTSQTVTAEAISSNIESLIEKVTEAQSCVTSIKDSLSLQNFMQDALEAKFKTLLADAKPLLTDEQMWSIEKAMHQTTDSPHSTTSLSQYGHKLQTNLSQFIWYRIRALRNIGSKVSIFGSGRLIDPNSVFKNDISLEEPGSTTKFNRYRKGLEKLKSQLTTNKTITSAVAPDLHITAALPKQHTPSNDSQEQTLARFFEKDEISRARSTLSYYNQTLHKWAGDLQTTTSSTQHDPSNHDNTPNNNSNNTNSYRDFYRLAKPLLPRETQIQCEKLLIQPKQEHLKTVAKVVAETLAETSTNAPAVGAASGASATREDLLRHFKLLRTRTENLGDFFRHMALEAGPAQFMETSLHNHYDHAQEIHALIHTNHHFSVLLGFHASAAGAMAGIFFNTFGFGLDAIERLKAAQELQEALDNHTKNFNLFSGQGLEDALNAIQTKIKALNELGPTTTTAEVHSSRASREGIDEITALSNRLSESAKRTAGSSSKLDGPAEGRSSDATSFPHSPS